MNRSHARRQIDFNKPLIQIKTVDEFYQDESNDQNDTNGDKMIAEKKKPGTDNRGEISAEKKKFNIIAPPTFKLDNPFEGVPNVDTAAIFKKRKQQSHYIRVSYINPVPDPDIYEATNKDLQFLKTLNESIAKEIKGQQINQEMFEKTIQKWEHDTAKGEIIPLERAHHLAEDLMNTNLKSFQTQIYNYWKGLRDSYKRPLLRTYLKVVNKDDNNPNAAFRTRENPRMRTRKSHKGNDQDGYEKMKNLYQDMKTAMVLMANIQQREMLKLEHFELNVMKFESSIKEKTESSLMSKFKEQYSNNAKVQDSKSKLKDLQKEGQKLIRSKLTVEKEPPQQQEVPIKAPVQPKEPPIPKPQNKIKDQSSEINYDIGAFIATVASESVIREITYQKLQGIINAVNEEPVEKQELPTKQNKKNQNSNPANTNNNTPINNIKPVQQIPHNPPAINKIQSQQEIDQPPKDQNVSNTFVREKPQPVQIIQEEKNIFRYTIRKRYDRFNRVVLERMFEEDEQDLGAHHKDYYRKTYSQWPDLITPEVMDRLHNDNLHGLYSQRFSKFNTLYPFNDSDDDQELQEFKNSIKKNLRANFNSFQKQKKSQTNFQSQSASGQMLKQ